MIQKIISVKDPKLRDISKPVSEIDKKVLSIVNDLRDTLIIQKDPIGVGLAAPQIGKNVRIFTIKPKDEIAVIINPEIISVINNPKGQDKEEKLMEGCLSLPNFYGPLVRPDSIKINFLDEKGNKITKLFEGLDAQIVQHEMDHLQGILFIDRLLEQKKPLYELVGDEWEKVELPQ
jgi:peptide deformylase